MNVMMNNFTDKKRLLKTLYNELTKKEKSIYRTLYGTIGKFNLNSINGSPHSGNIDFVIKRLEETIKTRNI